MERAESELRELQGRISDEEGVRGWGEELPPSGTVHSTGLRTAHGVVWVTVYEPDEDRIAELSEQYGAEAVCWISDRPAQQLGDDGDL